MIDVVNKKHNLDSKLSVNAILNPQGLSDPLVVIVKHWAQQRQVVTEGLSDSKVACLPTTLWAEEGSVEVVQIENHRPAKYDIKL